MFDMRNNIVLRTKNSCFVFINAKYAGEIDDLC